MALHALGSTSTTALTALGAWSQSLLDADIAAIAQTVTPDNMIASRIGSPYVPGAGGILATATTHSNTTLDTLVATGGGPLGSIKVGKLVLGVGIPAGTYVAAILSSTSVQLSQAATASASGVNVTFVSPNRPAISRTGLLIVPGRGTLQMQPGDVVALDITTGWPILVSAAAISASGSRWHFV